MNQIIVTIDNNNKETIRQLFIDNWGSDFMVTKGKKHNFDDLEGFVEMDNDKIVGVLTYKKTEYDIEIISLDSFTENIGIGTNLLNNVVTLAKGNHIQRLWLITTNDNLNALKFYQKRNWTMTAFYKDAVNEARKIKPTISLTGYYDIPIRHEIEMEYEFNK
jgi:ribosomal protein S18 acetylase RimI-like enzyme